MKKVIAGLMMSATVLGLAITATSVNVHADTTDTTTAAGTTSDTKANLTVGAGTLTYTKPSDVDFTSTDVATVYAGNYGDTQTKKNDTTITDFLGDNLDWHLTANESGFGDSALDSDNASTLTVNDHTLIAGTPVTVASGNVGTSKSPTFATDLKYGLKIKANTLLKADSYTNTITWNLNNTPDDNADSSSIGE
ncbi:hypothetical protein [Lacticaseibacillus porcinae]|uniref:hypothetical protein n=1 Tax=Lacticaseibacillus porcinae TaxID=1123687 RepID=UPI000F7A751C|nr:hypothetical protein [Lacticaseibacillus porcinae]